MAEAGSMEVLANTPAPVTENVVPSALCSLTFQFPDLKIASPVFGFVNLFFDPPGIICFGHYQSRKDSINGAAISTVAKITPPRAYINERDRLGL